MPAVAVAAGCGSSSGSNGATARAGSSSNGSVAAAKAFADQAINGNDRPLPTSAPNPQPGKKVWVLWRHLESHLTDMDVRPVLAGTAYLAWGTLR